MTFNIQAINQKPEIRRRTMIKKLHSWNDSEIEVAVGRTDYSYNTWLNHMSTESELLSGAS